MGNTSSRATIEKENEINKNNDNDNDNEDIIDHSKHKLQLIDILRDGEFWLDA